jgi:hypothetical protein
VEQSAPEVAQILWIRSLLVLFRPAGRKRTNIGLTQLILSASQRRVFACGSMVLFDHMFVFFALYERKKTNEKKEVPLCRRQRSAICVSPTTNK